ncbi:hypothetical protein [Natronococcus wangiae]|uniref:hypothetical protein n=1 Tax=Natronococcus wangiae TaxID=3068275 RepID=UPI00273FA89B|nr:hypothetical protein [Natronococcus sp. AD5]
MPEQRDGGRTMIDGPSREVSDVGGTRQRPIRRRVDYRDGRAPRELRRTARKRRSDGAVRARPSARS